MKTKFELKQTVADIMQSARDNALDTVLENTTKAVQAELLALDMHPQFAEWLRSSALMILEDWSGRNCESYGRARPLTHRQIVQVRRAIDIETGAVKKKAPSGRTMSQAERRAVGAKSVVSITLTPEGLKALDMLRGSDSRGECIEQLLRGAF